MVLSPPSVSLWTLSEIKTQVTGLLFLLLIIIFDLGRRSSFFYLLYIYIIFLHRGLKLTLPLPTELQRGKVKKTNIWLSYFSFSFLLSLISCLYMNNSFVVSIPVTGNVVLGYEYCSKKNRYNLQFQSFIRWVYTRSLNYEIPNHPTIFHGIPSFVGKNGTRFLFKCSIRRNFVANVFSL